MEHVGRAGKNGAPMMVAKIGGPTACGIEGSLLSSHPHVETAGSMFRLSWGPRGDSIVALAILLGIEFFTNGSVTRRRYRMRDSDFMRVLL